MAEVFISLGSNEGNRREYLDKAVNLLQDQKEINIKKMSSYYETEPVGYTEQPKFINAVLLLNTTYFPRHLLHILQNIELQLKRKRDIRWGPRTIDLDILFFGNVIMESEDLIIPHPRLTQRSFVLIPLVEIAPSFIHPITQKTLSQHLSELDDKKGVHKLN